VVATSPSADGAKVNARSVHAKLGSVLQSKALNHDITDAPWRTRARTDRRARHAHSKLLRACKVPGFQNHRPRAIPHRHSSWVHEYEIQVYGIPVQMIPGLWNEIIGD
jgi:hypothetical protein